MQKSNTTRSTVRIARRVADGQASIMSDLVIRARALKDEGRDVVDLGAGVPDYSAPKFLIEAGIRALRSGPNSYGDGRGMPSLRKALAKQAEQ